MNYTNHPFFSTNILYLKAQPQNPNGREKQNETIIRILQK